jgi:hypothetical protein
MEGRRDGNIKEYCMIKKNGLWCRKQKKKEHVVRDPRFRTGRLQYGMGSKVEQNLVTFLQL